MGKKFKKLVAMALSFAILATFCMVPLTTSAEQAPLKFGEDGKFKIVVFSDVQDQYPVHQRVLNIMRQAIERENPDLVVFTGDMTEINTKDVEVDYRKTVEQILAPVVEAGVPYSIVFGNHDPQSYYDGQVTSKDAMLTVWQSIGDCRTTDPAPELTGTGTCKIPVYASNGNSVAFNLWMVDSGSYQNPLDTKSGYDNPHADQLQWMAANNDDVNSIVFQHIPMPETYNLFVEDENGQGSYGGKKYALELKEGVVGKATEFPSTIYADDSAGEFATLKEMGNVLGVFSGHDHLNDFSGTYDGIGITSIPGMSYFNYGDEAIRGYGVIELDESDLSKYDYQTVKFSTLDAEAGTAPETVYDEYDEITYADLKENGNALGSEYTISGGHTFTYDATSETKSAILKFRWTAGTKPGFQFSFDVGDNGNIAHPFGVWIKRADQVAPNGAWHLKPNKSDLEVKIASAIKQGDTFDIELGRLKVLEGDPKIVGQYYVYLKVNGELIQEGYSNTAEDGGYSSGDKYDCMVSNQIRFGGWGNGGDDKISETPVPVTYDDYDEVTYYDMKADGNALTGTEYPINSKTFTYDKTSDSGSVVIKYRWKAANAGSSFQLGLDTVDKFAYMFGVQLYTPSTEYPNGRIWLRPGYGPSVELSEPLVSGQDYDLELGRLKVTSGPNAGKYYLYFKLGDVAFAEDYIDANVVDGNGNYTSNPGGMTCTISNSFYHTFWGNGGGNKLSASPYVEVYEDYDEVTFDDLFIGDISMAGQTMTSNQKYTYKATSSSYSVKLNYRWIPGGDQPKFTSWFDTSSQYPFCFAVKTPNQSDFGAVAGPNGAWHLVPSNAALIVQMDQPIVAGQPYDIEIGRLKVLNGANKGKYYVYFNVNGETIQSYYYDGVDADGKYNDGAIALSNTVRINIPAGNSVTAIPVPETYDEYDEIGFNDLFIDGTSMDGQVKDDGNHTYTYDATSDSYSSKIKFRWIPSSAEPGFTAYLDDWKFPFCFCAKYPNRSDFGAAAGANGAWHLVPSNGDLIVQMDEPVVAGDPYDIEIGRLKVLTGSKKDKYYVYVKVNDELIQSYYYDGVVDGVYDGVALSNKIIIASAAGNAFCDVSTVIEEEDPNPDAPYYDYDEITYYDLIADGKALSDNEYPINTKAFTYNKTSETGSAIVKFRWKAANAGSEFQLGFDTNNAFAYMFGVQLYKTTADANYPNGFVWLRPGYGPKVELPEPLVNGENYDIEFARLKVKNGDNAGKYYMYFKINGELLVEDYVDADVVDKNGNYKSNPGNKDCTISNNIYLTFWGNGGGNKIAATPVPESYEAYDEIGYNDLFVGDISMSGQTMTSNQNYTYNATSPSYSVIFKYRWIPGGNEMKFTTFLDDWVYPFCFAAKTPNQSGFGATAGPNGSWHLVPSKDSYIVDMSEPVVAGKPYDIEIARLKVATGVNAGKYYVYAKVNGEMIQSYYYDGVVGGVYNGTALSNKIIIAIPEGNGVTAIPFAEEYEAYDEIGMEDLKDTDGNALGSQLGMSGATALTYDKTSPTGSVIFKYRWKIGTVPKFQMSFEKTSDTAMAYMFGAWLSAPGEEADYPNGRMWLRPGMGPQVNMEDVLVAGTTHNVEFARLKVKNGPNKGKYYVYIKIDDILVADDYVAADIVDANGNYTSNPDSTSLTISNEIFFAFWGSEGNSILAYRELGSNVHDGTRGDFDGDGVINGTDLTILRKILLGALDTSEMPEGIADFNNDGSVDVRDLVSMKKYLAPVNSYEKDGALVLGMQEHLNEDYTKTAEYIADASATLGATAYRLSTPIHTLYYANKDNSVTVKEDAMNEFKGMVAALKAKGINEILYVTDSFILPYGYANSMVNHNITVPDPNTDPDNYVAWLTVNVAAFTELAKEVPEIKFFEPFNEINTKGTRFEKYGCPWEATEEQRAAHKFTVKEKAAIMADLCWYLSDAVKSVDPANQVTTPSIVVGSNSVIENDFIDEFYKAIESGLYPTNKTLGDIKVDNYFTIVNLHAYPDYTEDDALLWDNFESNAANEINEWAGHINTAYATVKSHNDGGSRVWITETGMSTYHSDGAVRNEDNVARLIELALEKLDNELTFIDTAIFYKIADISTDRGASPSETYFGLFRSGDDLDDPYAAKPSAKAIYKFFHNGSTDYSALEALVDKYAE